MPGPRLLPPSVSPGIEPCRPVKIDSLVEPHIDCVWQVLDWLCAWTEYPGPRDLVVFTKLSVSDSFESRMNKTQSIQLNSQNRKLVKVTGRP